MKKTYSKPEIYFEDFTLCNSIAVLCDIKAGPTSGECGYAYEGGNGQTIFLQDVSGCFIPIDDDRFNGFCYHVPIETNNLFNS